MLPASLHWTFVIGSLVTLLLAGCSSGGFVDAESDATPRQGDDSGNTEVVSHDTGGDTAMPLPLERAVVARGDAPTNLLVISIDTLRRDYIGALSARDTTPFLDSLIAEGVVLNDHASCANWTLNALLCAQTGRYTVDLGFHAAMGGEYDSSMSVADTVDRMLKQRGYDTALSTANAYFQPSFGLGRGWDSVVAKSQWVAEESFESALAQHVQLASTGAPWYLHVHLLDPHSPYSADPVFERNTEMLAQNRFDFSSEAGFDELRREWDQLSGEDRSLALAWVDRLYAAELRSMDEAIRVFMEALADRGALEDTLVVIWSDHGEQFYEDDGQGHGLDLHDEETDAFALFWMADRGLEAGMYPGPTTHIDLAPTVFDLLALPQSDQFEGEIAGLASAERGRLVVHWNQREPAMAWQVGNDKLIYRWDGSLSLFERTEDRGETVDVAPLRSRRVGVLWSELQPQVEKMLAIHPSPDAVEPEL